jgi:hypothetical protein
VQPIQEQSGSVQHALDARVRSAVYERFVVSGLALTRGELAAQLAVPREDISAAYQRLAAQRALVLDPRSHEIAMAIPFSATPTPILVRSGERQWWANCAWDGLGIPAMLGCDAAVETVCPASGAPIVVRVRDGEPSQADCVLHFAVPLRQWWADIGAT